MVHYEKLVVLTLALGYIQSQNMSWFDLIKYRRILGQEGTYIVHREEIYQNLIRCAMECVKVVIKLN